jgi:hypothetical protein
MQAERDRQTYDIANKRFSLFMRKRLQAKKMDYIKINISLSNASSSEMLTNRFTYFYVVFLV